MSKKILIINWRDPESPMEGGAERFTLKYAQYWQSLGHTIFWLTNSFPGSEKEEKLKEITFIRLGPSLNGSLFSYLFSYPLYLLRTIFFVYFFTRRKKIDLVIDEIHGLPFFTPLYVKAQKVLLVCEVAGSIWDKMFPFPFNIIGRNAEKLIYAIYTATPIWAISENTKKNIESINSSAQVGVIDLGFEYDKKMIEKAKKTKKTSYPSAIFLARLVPMKGIEAALESLPLVLTKYPDFKLFVVGKGLPEYEHILEEKVMRLGIEKNVSFLGFHDGLKKYQYLAQAHFLLHPSYKEGFGLTLIEAGIVGTPAIIRSGSSMDALVEDGKNGFTFTDDQEISNTLIDAISTKKYAFLSKSSEEKAQEYTWDKVLKRSDEITKIR